jgi:hypothetical protein
MIYFKIGVFSIILLLSFQDKQFVEFKSELVKISSEKELVTVVLPFEILEDYHIQSEEIGDGNFIATEIHFDNLEGFKILGYQFSKVNRENLVLGQLKCEVLSNQMEITLRLEKTSISKKSLNLKGHLYYQACDDRQCFYPRNLQFSLKQSI